MCHGSFRRKNDDDLISLSRVNRNEWQNPFGNGRKDGVHQYPNNWAALKPQQEVAVMMVPKKAILARRR